MSEAVRHVKDAAEFRRIMCRSRRHRKCWRKDDRFDNRLRNKDALPPSAQARWQARLGISVQLREIPPIIPPISDAVVEDVRAVTEKCSMRWNSKIFLIEQGS